MFAGSNNTNDKKISPFEIIYQSAKQRKLEENQFLDARQGVYTVASKLAQEGDVESVMYLIKNGASVHEAARGAVMGKHYEFAFKLYAEYGADIHYLALGANDYEFAVKLLNNYGADICMIARGAGISGNIEYMDKLSQRHLPDSESSKSNRFYSNMAKGAMIGGQVEYALALLEKHKTNIEDILEGVIISGNILYIEEARKKYEDNEDIFISLVKYLAKCAAYQGNKEYCIKLLNDAEWNANEDYNCYVREGIVKGLLASGNLELLLNDFKGYFDWRMIVRELTTQSDVTEALYFLLKQATKKKNSLFSFVDGMLIDLMLVRFAQANQFECIALFYNNIFLFNKSVSQEFILKKVRQGLVTSARLPQGLHQLSFIDDPVFLNAFKDSIPSDCEDEQEFKAILSKAIKLNQLRKKYNIDYEQALALLDCADLRKLFLYMPFNIGDTLLFEIAFSIIMTFSPLSRARTEDLYKKISFSLKKSFLVDDLEKYGEWFGWHWKEHGDKAKNFLQEVEKSDSRENIMTLIKSQKDLFNNSPELIKDKNGYYGIVEKHAVRLG